MKVELETGETRPRLLVVDDEPLNLRIMHQLLRDDYDVFMASGGEEALQQCARVTPDLVLLDIEMPDISGLAVCRRLRAERATQDIPVIFVTACDSPAEETCCFKSGGVDFIRKPINPAVLHARVATHVTMARQARRLREMAFADALTGINNRRAFERYLHREHRACRRDGVPLGLVLLDIDHFKAYNDRYGHQAGDTALRSVATILHQSLRRPRDFLARYGGEELACVLTNADADATMRAAEYLRSKVDDAGLPHEGSTVKSNLTVSVGAAAWVPRSEGYKELIAAADASLYQAKARGRNQVCVTAAAEP